MGIIKQLYPITSWHRGGRTNLFQILSTTWIDKPKPIPITIITKYKYTGPRATRKERIGKADNLYMCVS